MQPDIWEDKKEELKRKFKLTNEQVENNDIEDDFGVKGEEKKEVLEFESLAGKIKIEYITRPVIIDKKMHYAKTHGGGALVEYVLSQTEFTHKIRAYKWDIYNDQWEELDGGII